MKKYGKKSVVIIMLFVLLFSSISSINTYAATTKPAKVKTLKKVKVSTKYYNGKSKYDCNAISTAKIKYSKVKGATGYQVLVYQRGDKGNMLTPLVYSFTTKKTTYTIKNLVPAVKYTIKVRAYKKDKNGKVVYGKTKSLKFTTPGEKKGCYFTCNGCHATMPGNDNLLARHIRDVNKIHKEIHAGYTIYWR